MITGYTGSLSVNDGVSHAQQALTDTAMVQVPFGSVKIIEFASIDQADTNIRKIPAMTDPGNVGFSMLFTKAAYNRLVALKGVLATWQITTPTGTDLLTFTFSAILVKADVEETPEALMEIKGDLSVSGVITIA